MDGSEDKDKVLSLFDCATLFAESMHEQFPHGCPKGTPIFMITTNGKQLAYLLEGPDDVIIDMIARLAITDEQALNIIGEGVVKAINHLRNEASKSTDTTVKTSE